MEGLNVSHIMQDSFDKVISIKHDVIVAIKWTILSCKPCVAA